MVATETMSFSIKTEANTQVINITEQVQSKVASSSLKDALATIFIAGATGGLTTIEYEPGLVKDIQDAFERIAPRGMEYAHHQTFHDGNGHSHIRASLLGPSLGIPVQNGKLVLGTYQQIVFIDFDNRPRQREIVVQMVG